MTMPSERTRRLWERLHNVIRNEEAWEIIEETLAEEREETEKRLSKEAEQALTGLAALVCNE